MRFRLIVRWPSNSILPTTYDYESARAALQKYRALTQSGTAFVSIFSVEAGDVTGGIGAAQLVKLARSENMLVKTLPRRSRNTIASVLVGLLASALPNGFGDFGVVSTHAGLRASYRVGGSTFRQTA